MNGSRDCNGMWELKLEHLSRLRFMTRLRTLSDERQISQRLSDGIQNKRNRSSGVLLSETEERNKILLTRQNHSLNKSEVQKLCEETFYFWIIGNELVEHIQICFDIYSFSCDCSRDNGSNCSCSSSFIIYL